MMHYRLVVFSLTLFILMYTVSLIIYTQVKYEPIYSAVSTTIRSERNTEESTESILRDETKPAPNLSIIRTQTGYEDMCIGNNSHLPACPEREIKSDKTFNVSLEVLSFDELVSRHGSDLADGGHFQPAECKPDQKIAMVVPYRDRQANLKRFLNNLHPFLKKQNVEYTIFVVEQLPGSPFNRGMIINIGFVVASKLCKFDCLIIHDSDLAPDDHGNLYRCGKQPRQHARDLPRWDHKTPYPSSFGGVVSITPADFIKTNGFSNTYFVWGREDDEFGRRVEYHNFTRDTMPFRVASYVEFDHAKVKKFSLSFDWFPHWKTRVKNDGLTTLHYKLKGVVKKALYTHIFADINVEDVRKAYKGKIVAASKKDKPLPP